MLYSEIRNLEGKEVREKESKLESKFHPAIHEVPPITPKMYFSIIRPGSSWMDFKCGPLRHTICAPRVSKMASKCHCGTDYSLHRSSCVCQHTPTILLPTFPLQPAPSSVSWHALCELWGLRRSPLHKRRSQRGKFSYQKLAGTLCSI